MDSRKTPPRAARPSEPQQLDLLPPPSCGMELIDPDTVAQMRRLFNRRWAKWHPCKRFEDAVADAFTVRLLLITVTRRRRGGG